MTSRKKPTVSQQQIARDLGVSQALVSLVLNGKRENISDESYQRIWDHALKMGYRPKGMQLQEGAAVSRSVGFILRAGLKLHTQSIFFSHVQHGLHEGLLARGYHSVFLGSEADLGPTTVGDVINQRNLAGIAVLGQVSEGFLKAIHAAQPNVAAVSFTHPGLCHSVMPNERQATEQLAVHLADLGHTDIGWIGGDKELDYNRRRLQAVSESLNARKLQLNRRFTFNLENGDKLAGWKAGELFLQNRTPRSYPTACVCVNGSMARGFLNCVMQRGLRIPEQLTVVAIDDTRLCVEEHPQLTGAHSDPEKIGSTTAELLLRNAMEKDGILSDVTLPAHLTVRETSGRPRA